MTALTLEAAIQVLNRHGHYSAEWDLCIGNPCSAIARRAGHIFQRLTDFEARAIANAYLALEEEAPKSFDGLATELLLMAFNLNYYGYNRYQESPCPNTPRSGRETSPEPLTTTKNSS